MPKRRKCPFCLRLFTPDPRVKQRQNTCGRHSCRQEQKRHYDEHWRQRHPDYFQGSYPHQKESYGTRADYKKRYRKQHPDYVGRNAAFVEEYRKHRRRQPSPAVSPTSCDLQLSLWSQSIKLSITHVSHTSRDIFVSVSQQ